MKDRCECLPGMLRKCAQFGESFGESIREGRLNISQHDVCPYAAGTEGNVSGG